MKNIKFKSIYLIGAVSFLVGTTGCMSDLDVKPISPQSSQTFDKDAVFAKTYASLSLTGQEGPSGNNDIDITDEGRFSLYRTLWNCNELSTDEAACSWGDAEVVELNTNNWSALNQAAEGLYARLYFVVSITNHYLEQTLGMTDAATLKQRAEVRFIRALAYYYLLDNFGNVPFTVKLSTVPPPQIQRADLFKFVEQELTECEADMFEPQQGPYYRVDKAANWLLKSRLYLNAQVYTGTPRWADAATYAKKVMDSNYKLCPTFKHLFMGDNAGTVDKSSVNKASQEIIFPIAADGVNTKSWGSSLFLIASTHKTGMKEWGTTEAWSGNRARQTLVKKFFPNGIASAFIADKADLTTSALSSYKDDRAMFYAAGDRTVAIGAIGMFTNGYSVTKFSNVRADGSATHDTKFPDTDIPLMRAAEAYLNYAEAIFRTDSTAHVAEALTVVNTLRARSKAKALTSLSKATLLDERSREFFFEGYRRTDLIRFGCFGGGTYNWDWKGGVANGQPFDAKYNLFPIPAGDLNTNPNLTQNPGY